MSRNSFCKLYYHVVWTTKNRQPLITPDVKDELLRRVRTKCSSLGCRVHALNAVEDHLHLVLEISPSLSVSAVIGQIKGASSHDVNQMHPFALAWQEGYGVVSFREAELPRVVRYVEAQADRHRMGKLADTLEQTSPL